jgi:8-oxo-dGTP pyrophosphatase MutT (NUDIX family)
VSFGEPPMVSADRPPAHDPSVSGPAPVRPGAALASEMDRFVPRGDEEVRDVVRVRDLAGAPDPWSRSSLIHATGTAVVIHPESRRVLLRWHDRLGAWLLVGGHADPGEAHPAAIARREALEETGLEDLEPWPRPEEPTLVQVTVVPVPAGRGEPAHEHADLRYVLATARPELARAESEATPLRWLSFPDAVATVGDDNVWVSLTRVERMLPRS